jgi:hypothetical protein
MRTRPSRGQRATAFQKLLSRLGSHHVALGEQMNPAEVMGAVGSRKFVVRAAVRLGSTQILSKMVADDLPRSRGAAHSTSAYRDVAFVEAEVTGRQVLKWVEERKGRIGRLAFELPETNSWASCERHPSHHVYIGAGLPWPLLRFTLQAQLNAPVPSGRGILVSPGLPTFMDYGDALWHYLYPGERVYAGAVPEGLLVMRIADTRCWIEHMHFAATHLTVTLKGDEVDGSTVELISTHRQVRTAGKSGRVKIPLAGGPDASQTLMVTRAGAWLDLRYLGQIRQDDKRADTTFEPPDWDTQLALLASQGESQTIEYKRQLPASPGEKAALARTVVAFANTLGGCLIYGVEEDGTSGTRIIGVQPPTTIADDLSHIVHDTVIPDPGIEIVIGEVEGKRLVMVTVPAQPKRFFAVAGSPPRFYVRRQANTYEARLDDIRALAETLAQQQTAPSWGRRGSF